MKRRAVSQTHFVRVRDGKEEVLEWTNLQEKYLRLTKGQLQSKNNKMASKVSPDNSLNDYSQKKSILAELPQQKSNPTTALPHLTSFFGITQPRPITTISNHSNRSDNKQKIDLIEVKKRSISANLKGNVLIAVISVKRYGLRWKISHHLIQLQNKNKTNDANTNSIITSNAQITLMLKQMMNEQIWFNLKKELYYFHLNLQPIGKIANELAPKQYVILVNIHPKLSLPFDAQMKTLELATQLQSAIIEGILAVKNKSKEQDQTQQSQVQNIQKLYDWQKITNVKEYVNKLFETRSNKNKDKDGQPQASPLQNWYKQRFTHETNNKSANSNAQKQSAPPSNRNPLFQMHCHYPMELQDQEMLHEANLKVQSFSQTNNRHQFKVHPMQNLLQKIRRQEELGTILNLKKEMQKKMHTKNKAEIKDTSNHNKIDKYAPKMNKKHMGYLIEKKNSLLLEQNIPYLMQKYGITRFQIYNLYNLYKSFEKVSVMRSKEGSPQSFKKIYNTGIDRTTFDEGLRGLDMNPGEELIRNICYFGDHISWEQFIKIVSISLRKTPQQKLDAILQGISSTSTSNSAGKDRASSPEATERATLSEMQLSIMIGSALHKIFEEDQPDLKAYFTQMAMIELGGQDGKVMIDEMKKRVMQGGGERINMVAFLILNS